MTSPTISARLDAALEPFDLLKHPFYQAWSAGTLPAAALSTYAREYGNFIDAVPQGWETLENAEHAHEEREHAELWRRFARSLRTCVDVPRLAEVEALVGESKRAFSHEVGAIGALFAFEAQQPKTARSKLDGLVEHYAELSGLDRTYFEVHADDDYERAILIERAEKLDASAQDEAVAYCQRTAQALWRALDGVMQAHELPLAC